MNAAGIGRLVAATVLALWGAVASDAQAVGTDGALYKRIRSAADLVCADVAPRDRARAAKACLERATRAGVRTARHSRRMQPSSARVVGVDAASDVASLH